MTFKVPERFRLLVGALGSDASYGNNGAFIVPLPRGQTLRCIASDGGSWEHVSVSRKDRPPLWDEMCAIKDIFWSEDDCVIQFHPPRKEYVNNHPHCLHLWRPIDKAILMPDSILVGLKGIEP